MTRRVTHSAVADDSTVITEAVQAAARRAGVWFWCLAVVALLDMGWLYASLTSTPSALVGLSVAASGLSLVPVLVQAARLRAAVSTFVHMSSAAARPGRRIIPRMKDWYAASANLHGARRPLSTPRIDDGHAAERKESCPSRAPLGRHHQTGLKGRRRT